MRNALFSGLTATAMALLGTGVLIFVMPVLAGEQPAPEPPTTPHDKETPATQTGAQARACPDEDATFEPVPMPAAAAPSEQMELNRLLLPPAPEERAGEEVVDGEQGTRLVPAIIPGRVVDASGRAVAEITVTCRFPGMERAPVRSQTDAWGGFVLLVDLAEWYTVPSHSLFLSAQGEDMAGVAEMFLCHEEADAALMRNSFPELAVYTTGYDPKEARMNPVIVVRPCGGLHGRAVDHEGVPVADLPMKAVPDRLSAAPVESVTDENGEYVFAGLIPGLVYQVCCNDSRDGDSETPPYRAKWPVVASVLPGETVEAPTLICDTGTYTLSGRVVDRQGAPIEDARVYPVPLSSWNCGAPGDDAHSAADGSFSLSGLLPGKYLVCARRRDVEFCVVETPVSVPGNNCLVQMKAGVEVKGRVVDAATGEPVSEFIVLPISDDGGSVPDFKEFMLWQHWGRGENPDLLDMVGKSGIRHSDIVDDENGFFTVSSGTARRLRLLVLAKGYSMGVADVFVRGAGMPRTVIQLIPLETPPVEPEAGQDSAPCIAAEEDAAEEAAADTEEEEATVPENVGWLTAELLDTGGKHTRANFELYRADAGKNAPGFNASLDAAADEKDRRLCAGTYRVHASINPTTLCIGVRIGGCTATVRAGRTTSICIGLPRGSATVVGAVTVQGLRPTGGTVTALGPDGTLLARGGIDDGGRFVLPGMPPGPVLLRLGTERSSSPLLGSVRAFRSLLLPSSGTVQADFSLEYSSFSIGRLRNLPEEREPAAMMLPDGWNEQRLLAAPDGGSVENLAFIPELSASFGLFLLSGGDNWLAAGDYTFLVGLNPGDGPQGDDGWGAPDWRGRWVRRRVSLPARSTENEVCWTEIQAGDQRGSEHAMPDNDMEEDNGGDPDAPPEDTGATETPE